MLTQTSFASRHIARYNDRNRVRVNAIRGGLYLVFPFFVYLVMRPIVVFFSILLVFGCSQREDPSSASLAPSDGRTTEPSQAAGADTAPSSHEDDKNATASAPSPAQDTIHAQDGAARAEAKVDDGASSTNTQRYFDFQETDEELDMLLGRTPIPPFAIDDLITLHDAQEILEKSKFNTVSSVLGQEKSPFYNALRYHRDDDDKLGLVLQYWRYRTSTAADHQYRMLDKGSLDDPKPISLGSQAFYTTNDAQTIVTVLDYALQAVVRLTCDTDTCHIPQMMRLYRLVADRAPEPS